MFKSSSTGGEPPEINLLLDKKNSRFQVAKVDVDDGNSLQPNSNQGSYNAYDSRRAQLTAELPPGLDNYREYTSVQHIYRPTLDELHRGHRGSFQAKPRPQFIPEEPKKGKVIRFGWLEGVFMRCLLNIWGVMLFLRLSWVIGQAGVLEGAAIICLANVVTLVTTISMSAVSTNGQIKGGGIYYMISRSLGPEFGGAIGLMFTLANSIAVAMYIVGFCESLQDLLRTFNGFVLIDGDVNDIRVVGIITLILILVLAIIGMDWVTRTQMILLVVLIASQVDFVVGSILGPTSDEDTAKGFVGYNTETFHANMHAEYRMFEGVEHNFFSVFAVFFPAVTGIVAGANLSGDLKDPSSAIPIGTLLAIFVTFFSYIAYGIMLGGCVLRDATGNVTDLLQGRAEGDPFLYIANCTGKECIFGTQNDNQVMELVSSWGPLIYGGCFAATLSSAIASLVGAPRVLQALAKDKLYPFIGFFGEGYGANNDPVRGYVLVFIISFGCILIAQLNAIAPLLSNFFLAAYALINFSVFHASVSKSPGWRPAFKFYNAWVSLVGTLLCIVVMFLMSWVMALVTIIVVITLYLYVQYRKPEVNWGSSTQAHSYSNALKSLQELNQVEEHVKNYRPQLLVLSGMPSHRPSLIDFAYLITKGKSLLICGQIIKGLNAQKVHDAFTEKANRWLINSNIKGFYTLAEDDNFEVASQALMQIIGLGRLRPNMILMGYKSDWQTCDKDYLNQYFNQIHNALDRHLAIGILRVPEGFDYSETIYDEDYIPVTTLNETGAKEEMKRKLSAGQLAQEENNDVDTPPSTPPTNKRAGAVKVDVEAPEQNGEKKKKKYKPAKHGYMGRDGAPLGRGVVEKISQFREKQKKGFIDVWWLYDDGGLTLLIPYILSTRTIFTECKLRIFSLANKKNDLDRDQRNLAALLAKFRIDYSDVIVIPDITKAAGQTTRRQFESLIKGFRVKEGESTEKLTPGTYITDAELDTLQAKTNRHMRLRELLLQYSRDSTFVVMALPIPRKGIVSAPLYMAWLELLTKGMPPYLCIRGNQTSVLTFYH